MFFFFPIGIAINLTLITVLAMLTQRFLSVAPLRLLLVTGVSGAGTFFAIRELANRYTPRKRMFHNEMALWTLCGLAFLSILDTSFILGKQGWPFQDWTILKSSEPYFSAPFHTDSERSVVLINALIRNDDSPFLNHGGLNIPLAWYQLGALFTGPFVSNTNLPLVMGWNVATAFLLFFFVFWVPWCPLH